MEPVRTCVGCRRREPRSVLLRVVAGDGVLVADPAAQLPGRGAWVHPDVRCVEQAVQRRAFTRALRLASGLDAADLLAVVRASSETAGPAT
ncbi:MAG TPA: YlxR family protein [Plantibacter sp.]|uniref:YlxR family protein n=1 Tax=unclassified Plantibacter TaxID=2624265 RepID=UPI002C11EE3F|nr:YlxR family protein [Plantibacter sp.]